MSHDLDALQTLWIGQLEEEELVMSVDDIHARAEVFQTRIALRNRIEYVAAALGVGAFVFIGFMSMDAIVTIGSALVALRGLIVAWNLHRQARAASRAEMEAAAMSWKEFHRDELVRQRDALRRVWAWYLGPMVPGFVVFMVGVGTASSKDMSLMVGLGATALGLAIVAFAFMFIGWINTKAAEAIQAQIDALDAVQ